jgi:magnesium transporter
VVSLVATRRKGNKIYPDLLEKKYVAVKENLTVKEALDKWKQLVYPAKITHVIYVIDSKGRFVGTVNLRNLFLTPPETKLEKIIEKAVSAEIGSSLLDVASIIIENKLSAIPIINGDGKLLGIITADSVLDAIHLEKWRSIYKLAGILESKTKVHVDLKSIVGMVKGRLPWLVICVILGIFLSGGVIKSYEHTIIAVPLLTVFIPVVMDSGGSISVQTSTIFVRALATKEIRSFRTIVRLFLLDLSTGVILGASLGFFMAMLVTLWIGDTALALTLFVTMVLIAITAIIVGFLTPFLSYSFEMDPAVTSGPLVTLIKDVTALLIYFIVVTALYLPK